MTKSKTQSLDEKTTPSISGTRVLVVDDEKHVRNLLKQVLSEIGIDVSLATSGEEALSLFKSEAYPIVLTDIRMGGMNGFELMRHILDINADTQVVIVSSYASTDSALTALHDGAFDYLIKPFEDLNHINEVVINAANNYRAITQGQDAIVEKNVAESASSAKSAFLANMSHEIRTPLTVIIGMGETLLHSYQNKQEHDKSVNTIISSGKHLLNLINGILDLSKIESGKFDVDQSDFSLFKLIAETTSIVESQATQKNMEFIIHYEFPLPETIRSDYVRLMQILLNLCSNAIKFTKQGRITLKVSMGASDQTLCFEVIDTGIGLSKEDMGKIFDSFTQAEVSTARKYGGTGLGLSLSKQLAELLGGGITVESKVGQGSQFKLTTKIGRLQDEKLIRSEKEIPETIEIIDTSKQRKQLIGHVLLAEDNKAIQDLIGMQLKRMNLSVTVVDNGESAVEKVMQNKYDLIFMDMQMPIMGGLEAVAKLRQQDCRVPIVILTANALTEDKEASFAMGCNDFMTKPIDMDELYKICCKFLQYSQTDPNPPLLSSLVGGDTDPELVEIIESFVIEYLPDMQQSIQQSIQSKDWAELKSIIHQLKGSAGGVGFDVITQHAARMMVSLEEAHYAEALKLVDELYSLFDRVYAGGKAEQVGKDN